MVESVLDASCAGGDLGEDYNGVADAQRTVDVVLSDMSAPWLQTTGFWKRSLSNPYRRMMNTSGVPFKDHAGSMVQLPADLFDNPQILTFQRTFAVLLWSSALKFSRLVGTLSASFIRGRKIKPWRSS
jgi:21S rRNA (uridine2791-2'-O)-methyltransferase